MQQHGLVILVPIKPGQIDKLEQILRHEIKPAWSDAEGQQCHPDMPFDQLPMLHFAAMAILQEDAGKDRMEPCLLFEATIDGDPQDFLEELVDRCGPGLDHVLRHCKGYPVNGITLPKLVQSFLARHNLPPHILFQGHPGRTIAEIRGENALRRYLVEKLAQFARQTGDLPDTRRRILRQLRWHVTQPPRPVEQPTPDRSDQVRSEFSWAAEHRAEPFQTQWGRQAGILFLGLVAFVIGAIGIYLSALPPSAYLACLNSQPTPAPDCGGAFQPGAPPALIAFLIETPFRWGARLLQGIAVPGTIFWATLAALASWALARGVQFACATRPKPPSAGIGWMLLLALRLTAMLACWVCLVALFGLGLMNLGKVAPPDWFQDNRLLSILTGIASLILGIMALLAFRFIRSNPTLDRGFGHATVRTRALRALALDGLWLFMAIMVWLLLVVLDWVTGLFSALLGTIYQIFVTWAVIGALSVLAVLFALLGLGVFWLLTIYARERWWDNPRYKDARVLNTVPIDPQRFAREGHGVNKVQNHMISLTRIKPGRLRLLRLRIVTFVINQLCYWWFTRGELGDVRDIHFLRWLIIDKGRRLLFLDTYQGSWAGYLDAFIDSGSVHGLNAIWSHTYQDVPEIDGSVGFPRTECLLWKGARDEQPFKAAVRASQKETIVWYSAYPDIGGYNVITNSWIRDNLFAPLDTAGMDRLISKIR